jgi:hypothetical protein
MMASTLGVDMVMTGHSLGRNKLEHLLASGLPSTHLIWCSQISLPPPPLPPRPSIPFQCSIN